MGTKGKEKEQHNSLAMKAGAIAVIFILIGVIHGFYASAKQRGQEQFFSGSDFCNGEYMETTMKATDLETRLMMTYKLLIKMGSATITITDPNGEIVFQKTDDIPIIRQHSILIEHEEDLGDWHVGITCNKADVSYEMQLELVDE